MHYLMALVLGSMGGWLFSLVHMPLPWTLGPLVAVILVKVGFKYSVAWPAQIRNIAIAVLGYAMGRSFTPATGHRILGLFPYLVIVTIISVLLSLLGGAVTGKYTGVNLTTSLFGSIPGGLSQMATICENIPGADISAITLMQTVRMLAVVFLVPFISLHGLTHKGGPQATGITPLGLGDVRQLVLFAGVIILMIFLAKYTKISGRYIILPILGTATLVLCGVNAPALPATWVKIAQVCVGIRMGMGVNITNLANWKRISLFSVLTTLSLLSILAGVDFIFAHAAILSFLTAFIATAPGGISEMGLTAMTAQADLSSVIAFQMFRLLFILIVAIPLTSWWLRRHAEAIKEHKGKSLEF